MSSLAELIAQKEELEKQIEAIKQKERKEAIAYVRSVIESFEVTPDELFGKPKGVKSAVAPKYRDPVTGKTWSGRGRAPTWLEGKNKEDFAI